MNFRMIGLLCALPLIATAVASAQRFASDSAPLLGASTEVVDGSDFDSLSERIHTLSLNRAGEIEGRIASFEAGTADVSGLGDLKVFFVRDGKIARETKTFADGTFSVDGLAEGTYSFVATGQSGFAAYGVRVVGFEEGSEINVMEAAAVSPRFSAVKSILEKNLPSDIADEIVAISRNADSDRVVGSNRVRLSDGQLVGHVLPMLGDVSLVEGTEVHIIQDDEQVAQVAVDERGSFMVPDLEPGVYDFVAAGPSGFAAVSFQAIDDSADSVLADTDEIPVAIPAAQGSATSVSGAIPADIPFDSGYVDSGYIDSGYSDSLDVCLTCQQDSGFVSQQAQQAGTPCGESPCTYDTSPIEYAGNSLGCGSAAGGACGGCSNFSGLNACTANCSRRGLFGVRGGAAGGFGGGGGIGGLVPLSGLVNGIVAVSIVGDNNNDPADATPSEIGN